MEILKAAGMAFAALGCVLLVGWGILKLFILKQQNKKRKDDQFKNLQNS